jgi:hypothetical protein
MGTMGTMYGFSGKSYEKIVQEKDPGNRENGVHGARNIVGKLTEMRFKSGLSHC